MRSRAGSANALSTSQASRRDFFRLYELAQFPPGWTWFVDGGVLENKPFGPAIEAIRERPAEVEVDRRLLYLEPDPGEARAASEQKRPGTLVAAVGALTGLPRAEPILDDLVEVGALNERVARIGDIIETTWGTVEQLVRQIAGPLAEIPEDPNDPALAQIRARLDEKARTSAGLSYATYVRLKISGVVDRYAETACAACDLPSDSTHALLVRSVIRCWAEGKQLFARGDMVEPTPVQLAFLIGFDLGYGQRRLRFAIDGLNALYQSAGSPGYPAREEIDAAKARVWEAVVTLRDAMSGTGFDEEVNTHYGSCFAVDAMRAYMLQWLRGAGLRRAAQRAARQARSRPALVSLQEARRLLDRPLYGLAEALGGVDRLGPRSFFATHMMSAGLRQLTT